jgi:hypothetical protein
MMQKGGRITIATTKTGAVFSTETEMHSPTVSTKLIKETGKKPFYPFPHPMGQPVI